MKLYKKSRGFTLPEIMITMGVIAIVLSTAVPSVNSVIKNNRLATQLNSVVTHIHMARAEAVKRNVRVILCRSASPNATSPTCGGDTKIWESGYIVFADDGNNSNNVYNAATDTLLARGQPAVPGVKMRTNSTWNNNLEFKPDGSTNEGGGIALMSFCDDRGNTHGRQIRVAANGVPRMYAENINSCYP
ncbi:MAG: GspH/FimT family pseudopilin [Gammaproteobacteria bacterium]|jgi:type IV fimbrial biogenesis protein FimT|nr:GspH/FimT family pseudopilin [Gammaproteobacteria bacterium]